MEERIANLESKMMALTIAYTTQQESISRLKSCLDKVCEMLEKDTKFKADLVAYCKALRKEIDKLKDEIPV